LSRLGLRAGEVAALELHDLHWVRGELVVRGKGQQESLLPIPDDVGKAMVAYLRRGRPRKPLGNVFLTVRAPYRGLSSSAVSCIVRWACKRAGLLPAGAHRLRHTAATQMLRQGISLTDIGQVLRHRSIGTTAIYAKVDFAALHNLARPWPGGTP